MVYTYSMTWSIAKAEINIWISDFRKIHCQDSRARETTKETDGHLSLLLWFHWIQQLVFGSSRLRLFHSTWQNDRIGKGRHFNVSCLSFIQFRYSIIDYFCFVFLIPYSILYNIMSNGYISQEYKERLRTAAQYGRTRGQCSAFSCDQLK